MTSFALWMQLNMCSGYVPNDPEMSGYLCKAQYDASLRVFEWPLIPSYSDHPYRARPVLDVTYILPERRLWRSLNSRVN